MTVSFCYLRNNLIILLKMYYYTVRKRVPQAYSCLSWPAHVCALANYVRGRPEGLSPTGFTMTGSMGILLYLTYLYTTILICKHALSTLDSFFPGNLSVCLYLYSYLVIPRLSRPGSATRCNQRIFIYFYITTANNHVL